MAKINNEVECWAFSKDPTKSRKEFGNPVEFLKTQYGGGCISQLQNLKSSGLYKQGGWAYDFRPYLKCFLVKQYDHWAQEYAPNVTLLRQSTHGKIQEIVEKPIKKNGKI